MTVQKFKEALEFVIKVVAFGAVVLGGICLLGHVIATGEFFEDVSFGDGLVLYMLSACFFVACALYWAGVTAVGLLLMRWPMDWVLRAMVKRVPLRALGSVRADYRSMSSPTVWCVAALALLIGWAARPAPSVLLGFWRSYYCRGS
jgi:hypothetical protein